MMQKYQKSLVSISFKGLEILILTKFIRNTKKSKLFYSFFFFS